MGFPMTTKVAGAALLLWIGGGAVAQDGKGWVLYPPVETETTKFTCRFDLECIDAEPCAQTTYEADLDVSKAVQAGRMMAWAGEAVLSDMNGETQFILNTWDDDALVVISAREGAPHLLTRAADGATRYSLHMPAVPMAITYLGICEEIE
ncbi:MAG: hypothetical protein CSA72_07875 [Rhodobacterales bacterium]|nr:MAG: hypothetical protein CSA72_07875 [Rhodobacterales bacterium]